MNAEQRANLTPQQIFDITVNHFLTQKVRCAVDGGCRYRDGKGNMCAVGFWILEEEYDPACEGEGVDWFTNNADEALSHFTQQNEDLLEQLQHAHDFGTSFSGTLINNAVKRRLATIAHDYDLTFDAKAFANGKLIEVEL